MCRKATLTPPHPRPRRCGSMRAPEAEGRGKLSARPFSRACPWLLTLLPLRCTVGCGDTKGVLVLCVCLQELWSAFASVELSRDLVSLRDLGWRRLVVLSPWGALCPRAVLHQYKKSIAPLLPAALWPVTKSCLPRMVLRAP